ncbi:MAG: hypothetical protein JWO48_3795 [Bryobacterales bacterium]|nr:hypothetical protein [Bryobacterales bacterium]
MIAFHAVVAAACLLLVAGRLAPARWSENLLALVRQSDPAVRIWTVVACSVIVVVGLLLLFLELRPDPRRGKWLVLKQDGSGQVTVSLSGVEDLVRREAICVPGVVDVSSRVSEAQDGLHILGRVAVAPDASIPDLSSALQERIKDVVEHHLGLSVTEVQVDVQLARLDLRRKTSRVA